LTDNSNNTERRSFLAILSGSAMALLGVAAGFIGAGFLYPVGRKKPPALFVALEQDISEDYAMEIKDPAGRKVLLMKDPDGKLMAISTVCTHLGCTVYYRKKKGIFECPCHDGIFDGQGNPVSGPPQTPLPRYDVEVRDKKVFVQFA